MDAFLLARLVLELQGRWGGSWVQGAWHEPDAGLVLKLRRAGAGDRTGFLLLRPRPPGQGLGLLTGRPPGGSGKGAVAAYARAHVVGSRLVAAACLGFERVVLLSFAGAGGEHTVVLEATGAGGNLLLLDPEHRVRAAVLPRPGPAGEPYRPPEARPGIARPLDLDSEAVERRLAAGEALAGRVLGLSPLLAAELAYRANAGTGREAWRALLAGYGADRPVREYAAGLSVIELTHLGEPRAAWAEALFRAGELLVEAGELARREEGERAREARERAWRAKLERRLARIGQDLAALPDADAVRRQADALVANLHAVRPGAARATVPDVWAAEPGDVLELRLDPALTPARNAERLYHTAARAVRARAALRARLAETEAELEAGLPDRAEPSGAAVEPARQAFLRFRSSDGLAIWVGRNGPENERLVREARPWDLWLHARDAGGAHVLVRRGGPGQRVPERTLAEAAGLAAKHSRRSGEAWVDVMVVDAGRVRKVPGGAPGRVLVTGERTVRARPGAGSPTPAGARR